MNASRPFSRVPGPSTSATHAQNPLIAGGALSRASISIGTTRTFGVISTTTSAGSIKQLP